MADSCLWIAGEFTANPEVIPRTACKVLGLYLKRPQASSAFELLLMGASDTAT